MEKCLKVLALLNDVNSTKEIVAYNVFYIHELTDQLDLEEDYRNWIEHREVCLQSTTDGFEIRRTRNDLHFKKFNAVILEIK